MTDTLFICKGKKKTHPSFNILVLVHYMSYYCSSLQTILVHNYYSYYHSALSFYYSHSGRCFASSQKRPPSSTVAASRRAVLTLVTLGLLIYVWKHEDDQRPMAWISSSV